MRIAIISWFLFAFVSSALSASYLQFDYWVQTTTEGKAPAARNSHSAVVNPVNNTLLVFGGRQGDQSKAPALNAMYKLDLVTDTWIDFTPAGPRPLARFGHSAVATPYQTMIVFGGQNSTNYFNDVFKYDFVTDTWTAVDAGGVPPAPRGYHSAVISPILNAMIVFGGIGVDNSDTIFFDDVSMYDLATDSWLPVTQMDGAPTPRGQHSAVVTPLNIMLIFGGFNGATTFSDVNRYDIANNKWLQPVAIGLNDVSPPALRGHTAVVSPQQKMLIFGGVQDDGSVIGDVYKLDFGTLKWQSVSPGGVSGPNRAFHSSTVTPFDTMVVFSGHGSSVDVSSLAKYSLATTTLRSYNDGVVMVVLITIIGTMVISLCVAMDLMNERAEEEKIEYAREAARNAIKQLSSNVSIKEKTDHLRQVTVDAGKKMQVGFNVMSDKIVSAF